MILSVCYNFSWWSRVQPLPPVQPWPPVSDCTHATAVSSAVSVLSTARRTASVLSTAAELSSRSIKFFFTSNIADFRLSQDFCFRREIKGVTKNCMVLKSAIFELKKNFLGLNRSEFNQYLSQGIHFLIGVQIEALFNFLCFGAFSGWFYKVKWALYKNVNLKILGPSMDPWSLNISFLSYLEGGITMYKLIFSKMWISWHLNLRLTWVWPESDLSLTWVWPESDTSLTRVWPESDTSLTRVWPESNLSPTWVRPESDLSPTWVWSESDLSLTWDWP